jgi:hypothetical protein
MRAIILNASAWMIVPVMDAFAKHLTATMPVLQITWARYFFTVVFTAFFNAIFLQGNPCLEQKAYFTIS